MLDRVRERRRFRSDQAILPSTVPTGKGLLRCTEVVVDFGEEHDGFERACGGFRALVACLRARALQGLVQAVAGQHTEGRRNARLP